MASDGILRLSVRSSIRPFVCYQNCEHDILKQNELISIQIGASGLRVDDMKRSTLGSGDQMSVSHAAEDRFGGLAEASISFHSFIHFCRVAFFSLIHISQK